MAYIVEVLPVSSNVVESIRSSKMQIWLSLAQPASACPSRSAFMDSIGIEFRNTFTARERSR